MQMDLGGFGCSVSIQVLPEQRAKSSGVRGGAAEPDHEEGLGRGQPLLDIEVKRHPNIIPLQNKVAGEDDLEGLTSTLAQ